MPVRRENVPTCGTPCRVALGCGVGRGRGGTPGGMSRAVWGCFMWGTVRGTITNHATWGSGWKRVKSFRQSHTWCRVPRVLFGNESQGGQQCTQMSLYAVHPSFSHGGPLDDPMLVSCRCPQIHKTRPRRSRWGSSAYQTAQAPVSKQASK